MPSLAEPIPSPTSRPRRAEPALFALAAHEREMFFPGRTPADLFPGAWQEVDPVALRLGAAAWEGLLRERRPAVLVTAWSTPPLPAAWIAEPALPLRYVCHVTGTVRNLLPRSLIVRGVKVTNWGNIASLSVSEHALLLALAALRNLAAWPEAIRRTRSPDAGNATARLGTRSLYGRSVGIHGFGQVARSLIRLLEPFGVALHVHADGVPPELIREAGASVHPTLLALCANSEVFFECEALVPARAGMVNAQALAALPDGAVFVNVARGALVDEAALLAEARRGRVRIALDVVANDPVCPADPLMGAVDGIFSPHISGPTHDWFPRCGDHALANLRRYVNNQPLDALITPEIFDRST